MLKRTSVIVVLILIALGAGWYYLTNRTPEAVTEMSPADDTISLITALTTAIVSLGGAISGLAMKFLDFKKQQLEIRAKEHELAAREIELAEKRREMDAQ